MANKRNRPVLGSTVTSTDPAIQAYLDAKAASSKQRTNWDVIGDISGDVLSATQAHRAAVQLDEDNKRKELEAYENQFSNNVNKITENAGSLGEEYFSLATEEAKKMKEEYMNAVKNEDKETQQKLKMRLQGLSTSIQSLKENLTIAAELKNDEVLSNGRTETDKLISATCTDPANLVHRDGEWVWKNPKYVEGGDQPEFFTQDDFVKSLVQIDEVTSKAYLDYEKTMNTNGYSYVEGTSTTDFDFQRIKTGIQDQFITQDNIMSIMHDDFTKRGMSNTFKANISEHLDNIASKTPNFYKGLGIDVDGPNGVPDGIIDEYDYDMVGEDKKRIIDAITNKNSKYGFDYEMSKSIVADWLTLQAQKKFYGDANPDLVPNDGETVAEFKKRGGIVGRYLNNPQAGVVWKEIDGVGTFIRPTEFEEFLKQNKIT